MALYAQILARTERPTQALAAIEGMDVYMFPPMPEGTLICEKSTEALDVRIVRQVTTAISWKLGRGCAVLAIAGDEGTGFWCGLAEGGKGLFQHNRLTGPRDFEDKPASRAEVDVLCRPFGPAVDREAVYAILAGSPSASAVDRHAALATALGLPSWLPGIGYTRIVEGRVPPEAGTPYRPPRSLAAFAPAAGTAEEIPGADSLETFHNACRRVFGFLKTDFGFQETLGRRSPRHTDSPIHRGVYLIGPMHLRPGYENPYTVCYRSRHLTVLVEGLSFGHKTRLCLIDKDGRHLDLTRLVQRRDPTLLDLCSLAKSQQEQIPIFAETLQKCAAGVLGGDLQSIEPIREREPGFSFSAFASRLDSDYVLAAYGPRLKRSTLSAQLRRTTFLLKQEIGLLKSRKKKQPQKPGT